MAGGSGTGTAEEINADNTALSQRWKLEQESAGIYKLIPQHVLPLPNP